MENNIMSMVGAFIGIAIMLGIGVQILGNSIQDCTTLPDYNGVASVTVGTGGNYSATPAVSFTGGGGSGAAATATTSAVANGFTVASVTVTHSGSSYETAPTVVFTGTANTTATATATIGGAAGSWAAQCESNNNQTQNAYTLLIIILIVVAAVAILAVVRML